MSMIKYRVKEVAADFGMSPKEISDIVGKYSEKPKSYAQVLTAEELNAAKQYLRSSARAVYDSTGAIEYFYGMENLSARPMTPEKIVEELEKVTLNDVLAAARTLRLHTVYFLEGVNR